MPSCVVKYCKNNSVNQKKLSGITFHKFPRELDWKQQWTEVIRRIRKEHSWLPSEFSVVCSTHFEDSDLYITKRGLRRVVKYAMPKKMLVEPIVNEDGECADSSNICLVSQTMLVHPIVNVDCEHVDASVPNTCQKHTPTCNKDNQNCSAMEPELVEISVSIESTAYSPKTDMKEDMDSMFDTPAISRLKQQLRRKTKIVSNSKKKVKLLNQRVRRLKRRNQKLKLILKELKNYVKSDVYDKLTQDIIAADTFNTMSRSKIKKIPRVRKKN